MMTLDLLKNLCTPELKWIWKKEIQVIQAVKKKQMNNINKNLLRKKPSKNLTIKKKKKTIKI